MNKTSTPQKTLETLEYLREYEIDANILKILVDGGRYFSELQEAAGIKHRSSMSRILGRLTRRDLVSHRFEREGMKLSLYTITPLGQYIKGLFDLVLALGSDHCSCGYEFKEGDFKAITLKYGLLCRNCWSEKAGEIVEMHPVHDSRP